MSALTDSTNSSAAVEAGGKPGAGTFDVGQKGVSAACVLSRPLARSLAGWMAGWLVGWMDGALCVSPLALSLPPIGHSTQMKKLAQLEKHGGSGNRQTRGQTARVPDVAGVALPVL